MSSFKLASSESSSSSSSSSGFSSSSTVKYVFLVCHDLTKKEEKKLFEDDVTEIKKNGIAIHIFDYLSDSNRTFTELIGICEMLIINLNDEKTKLWYNGYGEIVKNGGENLVVIFQDELHKHINLKEKERIKTTYFAELL